MVATASVIGVETGPAALARRDDRASLPIDAIPGDQRLGQPQSRRRREVEPRLEIWAQRRVKSLRFAGVKFAHALDWLFEAVRPPQRLTQKLVTPDRARADEKLAQRLDNTAVDCGRRERLFASALDGMPASPRDQAGNVCVRDLV